MKIPAFPMVVAHRGASRYAPENTLAAFRLAADQGAQAIELDAKLCSGGEVVVIHDPTVDRTTNGRGAVAGLSLARLKSLDAGSFFHPSFSGEPIPTLEEVFAAVGSRLLINVELTNYATPGDALVPKTVDLVRAFGLEERVLFSSFSPLNLFNARRLLPRVPCALLALPGRKGWWARSLILHGIAPQAVNPYFSDVSPGFVVRQHQAGRKVFVWTVNDPLDIKRMVAAGVDGLITDDPPAAFALAADSEQSDTPPAAASW
jgi:glycerophosphoryl diester phosphodiesterase